MSAIRIKIGDQSEREAMFSVVNGVSVKGDEMAAAAFSLVSAFRGTGKADVTLSLPALALLADIMDKAQMPLPVAHALHPIRQQVRKLRSLLPKPKDAPESV